MDRISFKVNGVKHTVGCEVSSDLTLLDYIRGCLELRGTKYMCREGGCGACVVTARRPPGIPYAVNSCMMPITSCHGLELTTIEEVGNRKKGYHPLQTTLVEHHGSQCGYCTPGWIMSMYSLLQSNSDLTMLGIEQSLGSNVCRCTGYRPILEAFKKFAKDSPEKIMDIEDLNICEKSGVKCDKRKCDEDLWCMIEKDNVHDFSTIEIKLKDGKYWYRATQVKHVFDILQEKGDDSYMLVAGNTAKGAYPIDEYPRILIDINAVTELKGYKIDRNLIIGSAVTLTELLNILKIVAKQKYFGYLQVLHDHLKKVSHIPVRNLATIAGNLMIKHKHNSFASDIYLLLETVGAQLTLVSYNFEKKTLKMQEFLKTNMRGAVILNIMFPPLCNDHKVVTYKIMPRSTSAHTIVNAGFLYQLSKNNTVCKSRIVFGGLSPSFTRAYKTEEYLVGKELFKNGTLQSALKILGDELVVIENPPEPSKEYRRGLAINLFYKGLLSLCPEHLLQSHYRSGAINLRDTRPVSKGKQIYDTDPTTYPLNQPISKVDALVQSAGEAFYSDDLPSQPYEVFAAFTLTTVCSSEIVSINSANALALSGVIAFYTAKDIPGLNSYIPPDGWVYLRNEEVFCTGTVRYFNEPYGVIVAETQAIAEKAVKMVEVKYKNVKKPVIEIKEAIKDPKRVTLYGSNDATGKGNDVVKVFKSGYLIHSQYHFAMENISCVIHPTEEGLKVYTASHWTDAVQMMLSRALKIDQNCIDVYVRRIGGSFGIKVSPATRSAVACGLVVHKLNRPCRFIQSMTSTTRAIGKKFPSSTKYEVGVNNCGVIQYMNYEYYQDNGYMINEVLGFIVMDAYNNCYDRSRWNVKVYDATTDMPKNTWFRGPGVSDSVGHAELIMDQIAYELSLDPIEVRLNNLDKKKYGAIKEMYDTLKLNATYDERRLIVNKFNKENRWKKRGLRFSFLRWTAVPFGGCNVIVSVYHGDGTVVITHGGIEMGQGINTKAVQICAYHLNIPLNKIQVKGTDTIVAPNSVQTAASLTSQNVGLGVRRSCEKLMKRLEPIRNEMPDASWEEIVAKAYTSNIDLQAQSSVKLVDIEQYPYDVLGVSLAEVEIDVLTGESEILRVDIMEDVGKSLSPEIDIGQVEGAFVMGVGHWTSEKLVYDKNTGELLTNRPWNYYVPMNTDIPQDFRVYFRKNSKSYDAIEGAKAVGEPPLCMSVVVALAIREAISQARLDSGIPTTEWFPIEGPSTVEAIGLSTATKTADLKFN